MILIATKMILWLCITVHKAGGFWHQTCQHSSQPRWLSWSYFLFPFVVYAIWKFVGLVQNATICPKMSPKNPTGILDFASLDLTTSCSHCSLAVVVAASGPSLFQNLCTPYVTVASSPTSPILGKRWSSILEACPAQRSCVLRRMCVCKCMYVSNLLLNVNFHFVGISSAGICFVRSMV